MRVQNTDKQQLAAIKPDIGSNPGATRFSRVLAQQQVNKQSINKQNVESQKIDASLTIKAGLLSKTDNPDSIKLGVLSEKNMTVAQLLLSNPELKSRTWTIIHDPVNKNKPFQRIPVGSSIYFNRHNGEISWNQQLSTKISAKVEPNVSISHNNKLVLGKITKNSPTISDLLSKQKNFKSERWNIIHSELNRHKHFTKIPDGTTIYIDSKSKELSWVTSGNKARPIASLSTSTRSVAKPSDQVAILDRRLDEAVKPFMGKKYSEIDCYTLVVRGLKNMGIPYKGQDGLSRQLLQMAHAEGRADNAYFTGEGITQAMGEKIYTRAITRVKDINQQSQDIYQEMQRLMKKGDILSFSLESKGHTGIVSQNQNQWTYINSGRLDNSINHNSPKHGVGEETLQDEISNWIKLAHKRKESLQITVGRLDNQKLV